MGWRLAAWWALALSTGCGSSRERRQNGDGALDAGRDASTHDAEPDPDTGPGSDTYDFRDGGCVANPAGRCPPTDADCDTYIAAAYGGDDCNDADGTIHPGATENGFTVETVATDWYPNFGGHVVAVGPDGRFHALVAAWDPERADPLTYVVGNEGDWAREEVPEATDGDWQYCCHSLSIAVGPQDTAHILYTTRRSEGLDWFDSLHYMKREGGEWIEESFDSEVLGTPNADGTLAVDAAGSAHIAYRATTGVRYATNASGAWEVETVDPTGWRGQIALGPLDDVHVLYGTDGIDSFDVRYATRSAGDWRDEWIATDALTGLAVDAEGRPHVAARTDDGSLSHLVRSDGTWSTEVVAEIAGTSALTVDTTGAAHLFYSVLDVSPSKLVHAFEAGSWDTTEISAGCWATTVAIHVDDADVVHAFFATLVNEAYELRYARGAAEGDGIDQDCDGVDG